MATEEEKKDLKKRIKNQLDCSPKQTFSQKIYREYICYILQQHPKYVIISCDNKKPNNYISIKNLLTPFYSKAVSDYEVKDRLLKWFRWYKKTTEGRELIITKGEWIITYR